LLLQVFIVVLVDPLDKLAGPLRMYTPHTLPGRGLSKGRQLSTAFVPCWTPKKNEDIVFFDVMFDPSTIFICYNGHSHYWCTWVQADHKFKGTVGDWLASKKKEIEIRTGNAVQS
jgi:hypothetical protein